MRNIENYSIFIRVLFLSMRFVCFIGIVYIFILGCEYFRQGHSLLGIGFIVASFITLYLTVPWRGNGIYIGNGKIKVKCQCNDIEYKNGNTKILYHRYHVDEFELSELSKYGFSRELCGIRHISDPFLNYNIDWELVFILKNGKVISYSTRIMKTEGYDILIDYIRKGTGIEPSEKLQKFLTLDYREGLKIMNDELL